MVAPQKPQIDLMPVPYANRPMKNYGAQLLRRHIGTLNPLRSLDAGIGQMRNLWMFPGHYVGIGHNRAGYIEGLRQPINREIIATKGQPEIYLMRLESDFSFIAPVDLCVCTYTIQYLENRTDVLTRLCERVRHGGSLIVDDELPSLPGFLKVLESQFDTIDIVYAGYGECAEMALPEDVMSLTLKEMSAPNLPDGHAAFYLFARNKKCDAAATSPRPAMTPDNGAFVLDSDAHALEHQF